MKRVLAILGNGFDMDGYEREGEWILLPDSVKRAKQTADLFKKGDYDAILAIGGESVWFQEVPPGKRPNVTEAELLAAEMEKEGIAPEFLHLYIESKDLPGNSRETLEAILTFDIEETTLLYPNYLDERVKGIFGMVIPEWVCHIVYTPTESRFKDPDELTSQIAEQHGIWGRQKMRIAGLLPKIRSADFDINELYKDKAYLHEGSHATAEAAMGYISVFARR